MARTTTRHTIVVERALKIGVNKLEAVGSGVILPGQLLQIDSGSGKVDQHATASGASAKFVALENQTPDTFNYPTTAAIDIRYDDGDTVQYAQGMPGDVLNMWLKASESVAKGLEWLISDGSGHVASCGTGVSVGTSNPVGIAWQTVDASGGSALRCLVRIV